MHLAQDRSKWRDVVNTVMNDRALLHVISLVKKADTSRVITLTLNFITVTSHMAQDPHTAILSAHAFNRGCLDTFSGQSTRHL
jgi:hypothetical protein